MKLQTYNKTLNPLFWDIKTFKIKPAIEKVLLKIAQDFYTLNEIQTEIQDIRLLGSNAGFNWTKHSDLDVHIIIDFSELKMPMEYAKKFVKNIAQRFNYEHDIHIKGANVEMYIQDIGEINRSEGIYSLLEQRWLIKPIPHKVIIDKKLIQNKYLNYKKKIDNIIKTEDIEKLRILMKDIIAMRSVGLESSFSLYSSENIVFKLLRDFGHIKKLKNAINKFYDKSVTIKELSNRFRIIGKTDKDLNIIGIMDTKGTIGHFDLINRYTHWKHRLTYDWRYDSSDNSIYWWETLSDVPKNIRDVTYDYLKKNYNVDNPKNKTDYSTISHGKFK